MIDLVKAGALFDDIISKLTKKDYEDWLLMDNKRIFENLKVGDEVIQIDRTSIGDFRYKAIVVRIENNFIETTYERYPYPEIIELVERLMKQGKLSVLHRTFHKTWNKNYYDSLGNIDIELI